MNKMISLMITLSLLLPLARPASAASESACTFIVSHKWYTFASANFFDSGYIHDGGFGEAPVQYVDPASPRLISFEQSASVKNDRFTIESKADSEILISPDIQSHDPTAVMVLGRILGTGKAQGDLYYEGSSTSELAFLHLGYYVEVGVQAQEDVVIRWDHLIDRDSPRDPNNVWFPKADRNYLTLRAGQQYTFTYETPYGDKYGLIDADSYMSYIEEVVGAGEQPTKHDEHYETHDSFTIRCQKEPDCTPEIGRVRPYGAPYLGIPYSVGVQVYLPDTCPYDSYDIFVDIKENNSSDPRTQNRGDHYNRAGESVQDLRPGETREVIFSDEFVHDWDWTNLGWQSCTDKALDSHVKGFLKGQLVDALLDGITEFGGDVFSISDFLGDQPRLDDDVITSNKYGYEVEVSGTDIRRAKEYISHSDNGVEVKVPKYKTEAYFEYLLGMLRSSLFTSAGEKLLDF